MSELRVHPPGLAGYGDLLGRASGDAQACRSYVDRWVPVIDMVSGDHQSAHLRAHRCPGADHRHADQGGGGHGDVAAEPQRRCEGVSGHGPAGRRGDRRDVSRGTATSWIR